MAVCRSWSGGAAAVADEELPEDIERALEASHAFFESAYAVSEIRDFAAQPLDVLAREAVQVEHHADDDGRGNPLEKFKSHLFFPE